MIKKILYGLVLITLAACQALPKTSDKLSDSGVSRELAQWRKATISNLHYTLHFNLPRQKNLPIEAREEITFEYTGNKHTLVYLDFKEEKDKIKSVVVNGKITPVVLEQEHLVLPPALLYPGKNSIKIIFTAGDAALNRRENFLYTLFVPDRARTVFPVFDQPDLKAVFHLSLTIPQDWEASTNGNLVEALDHGKTKTLTFAPTEKLPTYLFSFAAGKFSVAKEPWRGKEIELLYRETDSLKITQSLPEIFKEYKQYVGFIEDWTGIPYPFQKYGMVAIPSFQFGGMEHPGAILLQSATLFLGPEATQSQLNNRSHLLAHEIAHTWFGDLVTMEWFDDVWTKEVFANFIADKATESATAKETGALKFLLDHYPAAYGTDRTPGANPIHQQLDNLENAGTMYGNIIYHKAPIMMRQLEKRMGDAAFQKGVRTYLNEYAFGNATWDKLVTILNQNTREDLLRWNKTWVNDPGRPVFNLKSKGTEEVHIMQESEFGATRLWPQYFEVAVHAANKKQIIPVDYKKREQVLPLVKTADNFVSFNSNGWLYGVAPVDKQLLSHLSQFSEIERTAAYIDLYENMLVGRTLKPTALLETFLNLLPSESNELSLGLLTGYISRIYWQFIPEEERKQVGAKQEDNIWRLIGKREAVNQKKILFKLYQDLALSAQAQDRLYQIWETKQPPQSISLSEEDYTLLAFDLQLRKDYPQMLQRQLDRIKNPDRKERFEIIRRALSFNPEDRDTFFEGLKQKENRSNEAAVVLALKYFHHPLRQPSAEKYLRESLELLPEIQKTGDIFFPTRWLESTFGKYQSAEAWKTVQRFLEANPQLNPKLREKILQETDYLRRARILLEKP